MIIQGLLDHGYDGNTFWWMFAAFSVAILVFSVIRTRSSLRMKKEVDPRKVTAGILIVLGFIALALFEIVTHS